MQLSKQAKADVATLPHGNRGRPLKLGDFDASVQRYIRVLRIAGGIVNRTIIIAAAKRNCEFTRSISTKLFRFEPELGQKSAGKNELCP